MTADRCAEMRLLIQADIDGDLAPADVVRVSAHLEACRSCAHAQAQLLALAAQMRQEIHHHSAATALHLAVRNRASAHMAGNGPHMPPRPAPLSPARPAASLLAEPANLPWWYRRPSRRWASAALFFSGFALASSIALLLQPGGGTPMAHAVVANHIRALQPGHLIDVASADVKTVKTWFDDKLDFAPPLQDLASRGSALVGARLDYLANRPIAALVYQHGQHIIDVFTWPSANPTSHSLTDGSHNGYNFTYWRQNGMSMWAVSDLNTQDLVEFARIWQNS